MKRRILASKALALFLCFTACCNHAALATDTNSVSKMVPEDNRRTPLTALPSGKLSAIGSQTNRVAASPAIRTPFSRTNSQPDEIGPNHRLWRVASEQTPGGQLTNSMGGSVTGREGSRKIMEIGTGMHYRDGERWLPSVPTFEISILEEAFVAERIQHKVRLAADLNSIEAVTVVTPDGITLRSTPVAIGLYDAASGRSEMIAGLTNSVGVLISTNQVLYENAFNENGVRASVLFTIERGTFAQDVILTARLNPANYGFPPETLRRIKVAEAMNAGPLLIAPSTTPRPV